MDKFVKKHAIPFHLEAEVNRLLNGRTRDVDLTGELLWFYRQKSWPQRSKITRAWSIWVTIIGLCFIPISHILIPHAIAAAALICLTIVPLSNLALYLVWSLPRAMWVEGLSIFVTVIVFMVSFGALGMEGGGANSERYITGALFFGAIALVVFDVGKTWSVIILSCGLVVFFAFLVADPTIDVPVALALSIYYVMGGAAVVVARRTSTIFNHREFLMSLRDRYQERALADANALLERLATCDPLTGLANRRSATERLGNIWADASICKSSVAFMMADIDHFKLLNDSAGHAAGDDCIAGVARTIEGAVRSGDIICRHGGEEFLIVLTDVTPDTAWHVAERIRTGVEGQTVSHLELAGGKQITISVGVAFADPNDAPEHAIKRADDALYEAKRSGRNRVCLLDPAYAGLAARAIDTPLPVL